MNINDYDVVIFDYQGTLSLSPSYSVSFEELIGSFNFCDLKPNPVIYNYKHLLKNKQVFVVGAIDCNIEIEQKFKWLKKYFSFIKKENCYFISGKRKKSEVVSFLISKYGFDKNKILFVDDREKHILDVSELGITSITPEEYMKICENKA